MDEEFKQMLLTDPAAALKQEGIAVPDGVQIKAVENTDKVFHLVLPPKPSSDELDEEQLEQIAGGVCFFIPIAVGIGSILLPWVVNEIIDK
jgi:hypothetical protein